MGLLSILKDFKAKRASGNAEQYGDTLKNIMTTKEQRLEAIEALSKTPSLAAIPQLLKRFDLVVDHGIQDNREKELVCELLVGWKEEAKPFVREAVNRSRRIAWPIKIAEKILAKDEFLELLLENVRQDFVEFDDNLLERNTEIVLALKEYNDPRIVSKVMPLVKSRDENVRMAAIDCLEAQGDTNPDARGALVELLKEPQTDDNSRLLGVIRSIVQKHNWA